MDVAYRRFQDLSIKNDVITTEDYNCCGQRRTTGLDAASRSPVKKFFYQNKKYNERECNSIQNSEYAKVFHFTTPKKNGKKDNNTNTINRNSKSCITSTRDHNTKTTKKYNTNTARSADFIFNHCPNNKQFRYHNSRIGYYSNQQKDFSSYPSTDIRNTSTVFESSRRYRNEPETVSQAKEKGHYKEKNSKIIIVDEENDSNGSGAKKKTKSRIYGFMKDFLKKKFCNNTNSDSNKEGIYVELPNNIKVINNNLENKNNRYDDNQIRRIDVMQDVRIRFEHQPTTTTVQQQRQQQQHSLSQLQLNHHGSPNSMQCRPIHLFQTQTNCNSTSSDNSSGGDNGGQHSPQSPSSEEDNSPTEMNNCRRLVDKPPLVKRLTMGLMKSTEESRPLVHIHSSTNNCTPSRTISDGYVNEAICESDKIISSKFGDSCRQSLTTLPTLDHRYYHDSHSEFNFKKKYLRETSSANSSPKMYPPSAPLRMDSLSLAEQHELKGAAWYQAGIPREISLEVLSRQNPGAFLVRQSSTKPGCFALSLRCPPPAAKVAHYLILRTPRGYKIKGFTKEFSSLRALITHHSVMPELLPVPLSLPRPTNNLPPRRNCDDFDTYDSLNDFRKQMSDLNV